MTILKLFISRWEPFPNWFMFVKQWPRNLWTALFRRNPFGKHTWVVVVCGFLIFSQRTTARQPRITIHNVDDWIIKIDLLCFACPAPKLCPVVPPLPSWSKLNRRLWFDWEKVDPFMKTLSRFMDPHFCHHFASSSEDQGWPVSLYVSVPQTALQVRRRRCWEFRAWNNMHNIALLIGQRKILLNHTFLNVGA